MAIKIPKNLKSAREDRKEDGKVKIVFHPIHGKNPKAALFTVTFSSSDISKMKKAL